MEKNYYIYDKEGKRIDALSTMEEVKEKYGRTFSCTNKSVKHVIQVMRDKYSYFSRLIPGSKASIEVQSEIFNLRHTGAKPIWAVTFLCNDSTLVAVFETPERAKEYINNHVLGKLKESGYSIDEDSITLRVVTFQ